MSNGMIMRSMIRLMYVRMTIARDIRDLRGRLEILFARL